MQKINTIKGSILIGRIPHIIKSLEAHEEQFDAPLIVNLTYIDFSNRIHLTFHEGCNQRGYKVFDGRFAMVINSSERVAMGGNGAFVKIRLFMISQNKTAVQIATIDYLTGDGIGTFRTITLGDTEKEPTFASLGEFEEAMSNAVILAKVAKAAIE